MRLGNSPADELPWEYKKQIRPVVQVSIAMIVIGFLEQISITNPYTQVLILRVFTVFIVLLISSFFIGKTRHLINDLYHEKIYIVSSYFLWYFPFLSSRFSSEIWSGIFFLLMISLYLEKNSRRSSQRKYWSDSCRSPRPRWYLPIKRTACTVSRNRSAT